MKRVIKIADYVFIILAIAIVLYTLVTAAWVVYIPFRARSIKNNLFKADHEALLIACREMITNRRYFTNDRPHAVTLAKDEIGMSREQIKGNKHVPLIIRQMNPICLVLKTNCVVATLPPPPRMYFIGYAEGSKEDGTQRLIQGLWYFDGRWKTKYGQQGDGD